MNARSAVALGLAVAALAAAGGAFAQSSPEAKPYSVECGPDPEEGGATVCRVDRATYVGWRTFHAICHTCHAQDAVGSTFAPDLLARLREIDKTAFLKAMNEGFQGQVGVMPPWNQDPNVNKYFEELWSYLQARKDGVLLPGRPKRLPAQP
jgi:cytochrome c5